MNMLTGMKVQLLAFLIALVGLSNQLHVPAALFLAKEIVIL
jgi:hypothetical protein